MLLVLYMSQICSVFGRIYTKLLIIVNQLELDFSFHVCIRVLRENRWYFQIRIIKTVNKETVYKHVNEVLENHKNQCSIPGLAAAGTVHTLRPKRMKRSSNFWNAETKSGGGTATLGKAVTLVKEATSPTGAWMLSSSSRIPHCTVPNSQGARDQATCLYGVGS